jgi:hypothetical protein
VISSLYTRLGVEDDILELGAAFLADRGDMTGEDVLDLAPRALDPGDARRLGQVDHRVGRVEIGCYAHAGGEEDDMLGRVLGMV